ncbi:M48 family metalloprotease [Thiobacillus denitrificans]|uniref:M48 family metalloprotease n=1 Tax=Thiobacillus denitrificans TaxID=36861 RepID=UPI0012F8345D|nr:M48 family metalloprotease [Thiobacillus denitrificans]
MKSIRNGLVVCMVSVLTGCASGGPDLASTLGVIVGVATIAAASKGASQSSGGAYSAAASLRNAANMEMLQAGLISDHQLESEAAGAIAKMDRQNVVASANSSYARRLDRIFSKHRNEDGLNINYKVYLNKEKNAFAMADGSVRVYSGLMDVMTDDELRFVIGHEIGHVRHQHRKSKLRMALMSSSVRKALAAKSNSAGRLAASEMGGFVNTIVNAQFSQSEEKESDDYGLALLKRHGYNQNAAVTALRKLADGGPRGFSLVASHPDPHDRAARILSQIAK